MKDLLLRHALLNKFIILIINFIKDNNSNHETTIKKEQDPAERSKS